MQTDTSQAVKLPEAVAAYFAADLGNSSGVAQSFTEHAVVIDEGREHRGRRAIARWKAEATAKYHYTSEPLSVEALGADIVVRARLTGDFHGSPIERQYRFALEGTEIARLEITA